MAQFTERELAARLADRGVMRVRLEARVGGLLERVRERSPKAVWFGDELIVPGAAVARPAVLDLDPRAPAARSAASPPKRAGSTSSIAS